MNFARHVERLYSQWSSERWSVSGYHFHSICQLPIGRLENCLYYATKYHNAFDMLYLCQKKTKKDVFILHLRQKTQILNLQTKQSWKWFTRPRFWFNISTRQGPSLKRNDVFSSVIYCYFLVELQDIIRPLFLQVKPFKAKTRHATDTRSNHPHLFRILLVKKKYNSDEYSSKTVTLYNRIYLYNINLLFLIL